MRKGFNGLAALAEKVLEQDPYSGLWPSKTLSASALEPA
jgi:hypothetical protein